MEFSRLSDDEVWALYARSRKELRVRRPIRTSNVVSERGEHLALDLYNSTPNEPKLQLAHLGTRNVDAVSRNGERYSIKKICSPNKTTGVFYGIELEGSEKEESKLFEYLIIVMLDDELQLEKVLEIDWETFLRHKKWHSGMKAWNLTINKEMERDARVVFEERQKRLI